MDNEGLPFDNPLDDAVRQLNNARGSFQEAFARAEQKKPEKGVPWHAKVINGQYYVPLTDVLELLKQNNILPKVREGLERRIKNGPGAS